MIRKLRRKRLEFLNYYRSKTAVSNNITLRNWVTPPAAQDFWLAQFIEHRNLLPAKKVAIFAPFGLRTMMRFDRSDYKIFVARENLHRPNWQHYNDLLLNEKWVDLIVGFDYLQRKNYIRFPLWLMWIFKPTDSFEDIKKTCEKINSKSNFAYDSRKFCAFLSSHIDVWRREIVDEFAEIDKIDCDGRLFHNNDELKTKFHDNKSEYLRNYRFNLCPENSDAEGYCTEKLFEAVYSGCVPIYWGAKQNPEPNIFNQDAIIFIKLGEKNREAVEKVKYLNENRDACLAFASQPRLKENAAEIIWNYFTELEKKLLLMRIRG
jgi:hypothetical protein